MSRLAKSALFVAVVLAAVPAWATTVQVLTNGDFETTNIGNGSTAATFGITANMPNWYLGGTDSSNYYCVAKSAGDKPAYSGSVCMDVPGNGMRYLYQTFSVAAGTTYTVSYYARAYSASELNQNPYLSTTLAVGAGTLTGTGVDSGSGTATLTASTAHYTYSSSDWLHMYNNGGYASYQNGGTSPSTTYAQYTFTFTPSAAATATLQFTAAGLPGYYYDASHNGHYMNDQSATPVTYVNMGADGCLLDNVSVTYDNAATPEPNTLVLLAAGLMGLLAYAWRKRR